MVTLGQLFGIIPGLSKQSKQVWGCVNEKEERAVRTSVGSAMRGGALALGDENGFGTGGGETTDKAERAALERCRVSNRDCRIEVSRCSGNPGEASGVARVPAKKESVVGLEPTCDTSSPSLTCWKELSNNPTCYIWVNVLSDVFLGRKKTTVSWSGSMLPRCRRGRGKARLAFSRAARSLWGTKWVFLRR